MNYLYKLSQISEFMLELISCRRQLIRLIRRDIHTHDENIQPRQDVH
jgi:hypothetical protein